MARSKILPGERYARDIVAGKIVSCRWVKLCCQRHLDDLKRWGTKPGERPYWFDAEAAQHALDFFDLLELAEGEFSSRPFKLEPFQQFIIASIFGWMGADGYRRFRTAYIEIGKGNGKSPLAAGVGLYGLLADGEPGAQIYAAAKDREQAKISWTDAANMVESSPRLKARVNKFVNVLAVPETGSIFKPLSSDQSKSSGQRVHIAIIDELHEHPDGETVRKVRAGTKNRRQALIFEITNSGFDRNSICWQHHDQSLNVLQGIVSNESWFAYVCGLDEGDPENGIPADDWRDEGVWLKANPGLGTIIPHKYLREQVAEAIAMPANQSIVRRLNFCQWTEVATVWMPAEKWAACKGRVRPEDLVKRRCFFGLDLSSTTDLSSLVAEFPPEEEGEPFKVLAWFWLPEDDLKGRSERDRVPYGMWVEQGLIELTPGDFIDYAWIRHRVNVLHERYEWDVQALVHDRWGAAKLVTELTEDGYTCVPWGQGFASMSAPMKDLETVIRARRILHDGNPVLAWNFANVVAVQDAAGNKKPDKAMSRQRIDGAAALMNAHGWAIRQPEMKPFTSVYEGRGIRAC